MGTDCRRQQVSISLETRRGAGSRSLRATVQVDGFETTAAGWYRGSPDLPQCRTVLAPVKDVPLSRLPSAILDERCARRHRNAQAGAGKRRRQAEQKSKMARKKCLSKISVRYVLVRCRTRLPSTVRIARG